MNNVDFENLSLDEKSKHVWEHGVFIMLVEYYNTKVILYAISAQYIEVHYNIASSEIESIALASKDDLNKYLSRIDIYANIK